MTPRQRALAMIAAEGAEFFEDSAPGELLGSVWAPPGRIWFATSCHSIAVNFWSDRPAGWRWLASEVGQGTVECDLIDCDTCQEARE